MIILHDPAHPIPLHPLPGLLFVFHCHRGEQHPFQGFDSLGRLRLPGSDHRDSHRPLVFAGFSIGWPQPQCSPTDPEVRLSSVALLIAIEQQRLVAHLWPTPDLIKEMAHGLVFARALVAIPASSCGQSCLRLIHQQVDPPIVLNTHLKTTSVLLALPQKEKHITASISHVNSFTSLGSWPNALHLSLPHLRFFMLALVALLAALSCRS